MRAQIVWLTAVSLIVFIGFRPSHAQEEAENILANGGFEDGVFSPWSTYGGVTTEVVNELKDAAVREDPIQGEFCLHIVVPAAGANFWDSGLQHAGHVFQSGKKYTLSAFLKCKKGTLNINFKPELGQDPWPGYGEQSFTMTEEWAEYSTTTPVFTQNVSPATITFHIAYTPGDFWIDGVRFYEGDYVPPYLGEVELASRPAPADGALHPDTWVNLSWKPGDFALSHDVYFSDNFDDVNNGAAEAFRGNQAETYFVAGFPGFPYPEGFVPGTTYYWRIDEVNNLDPNSPWKGDVWSFTVPPKTAYNPIPADGAKFIDPDIDLSWTAGFGAKLHTVYFGDNFNDVNSAAGGLPKGITTYALNTLESDKTYYWRIDEFDGVTTYKGDVWSFTTAGVTGGVRADYYKGMNFENHVLTRTDPQIDFSWGAAEPAPLVGADSFSVRWTGEVEAVFTEKYTFYTNSDDGVRLWVNGKQLVDNWTDHGNTENNGKIDLVAGQTYSVVMEMYENGGDAVAQLRWSSPHTPKQLIPQAALSLPVKASSSNPYNGAVDVKQTQILSWSPGESAVSHQVYFGTDGDAVKNAATSSPEYKGTKALGSESYDPGKLQWNTTYYWRIDEVNNANPDSPWTGNLWSFTTANFLIVDDFEDYDIGNNEIWWAWKDGLGYAAHGKEPAYPGNGTGSAVGDENTASYCEETIVHGGRQSMPLFYDNSVLKYSETQKTLTYPRDWTENGVTTLTIWFRGDSANAAETLYVALNGSAVVNHDNPNAAQIATWTRWNIDLKAFADQGVNLASVNTIAIGLGNKKNPVVGGSGTMYFDDIRLYRPAQ